MKSVNKELKYLEWQHRLQPWMSAKRLAHVKRVASQSRLLAKYVGIDSNKAELAGWLHDTAKELSPKKAEALGVVFTEEDHCLFVDYPSIWHAYVGPKVIETLFSIHDPDILEAVYWHTTGSASLSPLAALLFVADYIEPGRGYPENNYIQSLVESNQLYQAVFAVSWCVFRHLLEKNKPIHPQGEACYRYYLHKINQASIIIQQLHCCIC